jgi:AcrR family transcriptional regulator
MNRCSVQNIRFGDPGTNAEGLSVIERTAVACSESKGVMGARKDDRRVQRTQQLIRTALMSLIEEKGFVALTVQDIIDRANVGRATFYAHFDNKEDLPVSGFDGLRAALQELQRQAHIRRANSDERRFASSREMFAHIAEYRLEKPAFGGGSQRTLSRARHARSESCAPLNSIGVHTRPLIGSSWARIIVEGRDGVRFARA